ncbi:MAG TPA: glycoside hydrolase family 3 C-terminal domain-containing protein [Rectinemataceae bacterium]|nr:glycoside hydrolase family 3 C-terminal domain-containing protein [Rectinemataceae bacterium]
MKHGDLVSRMELEEKIAYVMGDGFWHTRGIPRLGIAPVYLTDGPHGVRAIVDTTKSSDFAGIVPTTCFPTASLLGSSFDPGLIREMGQVLGEEARRNAVSLLLGPGVNIKRSPLCGRNFEYFSEDPLLSSAMGAAWIGGVESTGIGTSLKHFAVNSQETRRMTMDALVDPRALREIYLAAFEGAVREGRPASVMAAYNKVNGSYCSQSSFLLDEVLRRDWAFEGLVVTDWGANDDRAAGLAAGCDLEMPSGGRGSAARIREALESGELDESALDRAVDRILDFVLRATRDPGMARAPGRSGPSSGSPLMTEAQAAAHHELARRIAAESMILLKNEEGILPLSRGAPIGVIGELARSPRYQGAGSSTINPTRLESFLESLDAASIPYDFEPAYVLDSEKSDPGLEEAALALAQRLGEAGGTLIFCIGLPPLFESEGWDRSHLELPANQLALFARLEEACPRIVAVWSGGSPVTTDWLHQVRALLAAYLAGQAGGAAIRDILFGEANPSGKLAESWPLRLEDCPAFGNYALSEDRVLYKEGIFVGYRWYASSGRPVRFPFGFGLSYSAFFYSDLILEKRTLVAGDTLKFSFTLANVGKRGGKEVAQVYLSFPESAIERPAISLVAFRKLDLAAGAAALVEVELDGSALRYWDMAAGRFLVETGPVVLRVGSSSAQLPLEAVFHVEGGSSPIQAGPRLDLGSHPSSMEESAFALRCGETLRTAAARRPFGLGSSLGDMADESAGVGLVKRILMFAQNRGSGTKKGEVNRRMLEQMVSDMPIGRLGAMSGDLLGPSLLAAIVELANHRRFRAILRLFGWLPRGKGRGKAS